MRVNALHDITPHSPKGHDGFHSRRLASRTNGSDGSVSITHATIEPGGQSRMHVHDSSVQIYVGLTGSLVCGDDNEEHDLTHLSAAIFEKGTAHFVENRSGEEATVLVITAPELNRP